MPEKHAAGIAHWVPLAPTCLLSKPGASPWVTPSLRSCLEFQFVLVARKRGEKEIVATSYARHHKQTTKKIHVFNGAEF